MLHLTIAMHQLGSLYAQDFSALVKRKFRKWLADDVSG